MSHHYRHRGEVYNRRREKIPSWTIDVDVKVQEVDGVQKERAVNGYNRIYSLPTFYVFVDETEELLQSELSSAYTHQGGKAMAYLRRNERKIFPGVSEANLWGDSAFYNEEMVRFCEDRGWQFSITADQTAASMREVKALSVEDH